MLNCYILQVLLTKFNNDTFIKRFWVYFLILIYFIDIYNSEKTLTRFHEFFLKFQEKSRKFKENQGKILKNEIFFGNFGQIFGVTHVTHQISLTRFGEYTKKHVIFSCFFMFFHDFRRKKVIFQWYLGLKTVEWRNISKLQIYFA